MGTIGATASEAAAGRRALEGAVQPFDHAAFESQGLGLRARQPTIELGDARALIVKSAPVLDRPWLRIRLKLNQNGSLVFTQEIQPMVYCWLASLQQ